MNPGEHDIMARVEQGHWWYRGLRDAVFRTLDRASPPLPDRPAVLDAGCGTGETLRFVAERLRPSYLGGFDLAEEALGHARRKAPGAEIYRGDVCAPEIRHEPLDLVLSLDVVYIPGVERALPGLRRLVDALRPGGRLVLNLPAYDWLYSEHDVAIHTRERYTRRRLAALLETLGLVPERLTYRLCVLFPGVVLGRLPGMLRVRRGVVAARSDLHVIPDAALNGLLARLLSLENAWIARGGRWPWGSSVFAVGRKP
jgi:SAM-dependent methyltransferase